MLLKWLGASSTVKLLLLGALVRLVMMLYGAFHDSYFRVKYTDIDYAVITDGAAAMARGGSPFERATFRYTPLLGLLMIPNVLVWHHLGKLLFCTCDIGAAYYSIGILRTFTSRETANKLVALFILFNPIVINVSTRGNSDMVVTFMSIVVVAKFLQNRTITAALWLGFAAHFKLYPIIYAAALVATLYHRTVSVKGRSLAAFAGAAVSSGIATAIGFAVPTALCAFFYKDYLFEALIYHFGRVDHRHNLSPYFYMMYLNMAARPDEVQYSSTLVAFVPQMAMLAAVGWMLRKNVAQAICIETILFVAFNKVCTVQYFVWFIPLLPFVFADIVDREATTLPTNLRTLVAPRRCVAFAAAWFGSLIIWMLVAMQLEFDGKSVFGPLWAASCIFFVAQVATAAWLARISKLMQRSPPSTTKKK